MMQRRGQVRRMVEVMKCQPRDDEELHRFLRLGLGLRVPRRAVVSGHTPPFAYVRDVFFEMAPRETDGAEVGEAEHVQTPEPAAGGPRAGSAGDCVVWANRGGGKTMLGAAVTLLDLLFKPGIQVRILGGSLEQSCKMFAYLRRLVDRPGIQGVVRRTPTQRRIELVNGSVVELLAQSERSVRGTRVHRLRCDEVEEFQPEVWEAAQFVTRSGRCGKWAVRGTIEALSTMHQVGGLMGRLVAPATGLRVYRWCVLDVMEPCPTERSCAACLIVGDCAGRAKQAEGFMRYEDVLAARRRSSDERWASEMMCRRPRRSDAVYPNFELVPPSAGAAAFGPGAEELIVGGMDFGLRSPLAMVWAKIHKRADQPAEQWGVEVFGEYEEEGLTLGAHLEHIEALGWPRPAWLGVDPAGSARNGQTGVSDIGCLRQRGYVVRARRASIAQGIERLRRRMDQGTLRVAPTCGKLRQALRSYHFDPQRPGCAEPVKDGPDHLCDALRYLVLNLELGFAPVVVRKY